MVSRACSLPCLVKHAKEPLDIYSKPIVWILGGPGVGKGTQCDKIVAEYAFTHFSSGDLLRAEASTGSKRAKYLADIMLRGDLVPNEIVLDLLKEAMWARSAEASGFLIDGYPRTKHQGLEFEKNIGVVNLVIYLEASTDTLMRRLLGRALSSGRPDDNEETIKRRLNIFLENNQQVLDQYSSKLRTINAEAGVDEVFSAVMSVLGPVVTNMAAAARANQH